MSDSDEEGNFLFSKLNNLSNNICVEEIANKDPSFLERVVVGFLRKDVDDLKRVDATSPQQEHVLHLASSIINGGLVCGVSSNLLLPPRKVIDICSTSTQPVEDLRQAVIDAINSSNDTTSADLLALECLLIGYSYFELFCQANYTGPELSQADIAKLCCETNEPTSPLVINSLKALESDGNYPFKNCFLPHLLLVSRSILLYLADPIRASWQAGIHLNSVGDVLATPSKAPIDLVSTRAIRDLTLGRYWLNARVIIMHLRLLQKQSYTHNPTLYKEWCDMITLITQDIESFEDLSVEVSDSALTGLGGTITPQRVKGHSSIPPSSALLGMFLLEQGLGQHFFDYGDKVYIYISIYLTYILIDKTISSIIHPTLNYYFIHPVLNHIFYLLLFPMLG
jgi:hypothetical protein